MIRSALAAAVAALFYTSSMADTVNIDVRSSFFRVISAVPGQGTNQCTINVGDTVIWTWFGNFHSVSSDTGTFESQLHNIGHQFQFTFNTPGVFGYHCSIHGSPGSLMFGAITVAAPVCPGDLDGNNAVDLTDLSTLLSNFGTASGATLGQGDTNADGDVDLDDLSFLLSRFGTIC